MRKFVAYFVLVLLVMAALFLNADIGWDWEKYREHITTWLLEAAVAIAIALLTASLVDHEIRRRLRAERAATDKIYNDVLTSLQNSAMSLVTETAGSVGKTVFGNMYSNAIFERTIDSVFQSPLVRSNYRHKTTISPGGTPYVLKLVQSIKYRMSNPSRLADAVFEVRYTGDDASSFYESSIGYVAPFLRNIIIGGKEFPQNQIDSLNKELASQKSPFGLSTIGVKIASYPLQKNGGSLDVEIIAETQEPVDGQYTNITFYALEGLTVEAEVNVENLKVAFIPLGMFEFDPANSVCTSTYCRAEYRGVLLAGSGWNLRWNVRHSNEGDVEVLDRRPD